jgi:hypothetical protein
MVVIHKYFKYYFAVLVLFAMIALTIIGCKNISDYDAFSFKKDDIRFIMGGVMLEHPLFTFEYPANFILEDLNKMHDLKYDIRTTEVGFSRHGTDNSKYLDESVINIQVFKPEYVGLPGVIDAKTGIEYTINALNKSGNFKIMERGQKVVAGLSGEYIDFISYSNIGNLRTDREIRTVYFDYKYFIWWVEMMSPLEVAQKERPYFEHLLQTFKFLAPYPEGLNNVPVSSK